ncbi:hypothetical protein B0J17DRAFT_772208 [Rhizoctonia solani]|nr:hypothetical protein B0J17DRAFT_772208 [Rhizoctonia solani]
MKYVTETEPENLQFTNLPHELFSEIAKRLYPLDLIHLTRVDKFFHRMFMDRSSAEIWRATLTNAGLPPCPDDTMSEPEYAALMFEKQCTDCGDPASRRVDPIFMRMRDEFEEADQEYSELREERDHHAMVAYIDERKEIVRVCSQKAKPLVEWVQNREKQRKLELNKLQMDRRAGVEARLLQLGWAQVDVQDCFYFSPDANPMVSKSKVLNDADWSVMLPHLLQGLETARGHRLEREAGGHNSTSGPIDRLCQRHHEQGKKQDITIKIPSLPANRYVLKWPLIEELLNHDKPTEEFNPGFEGKKGLVKEQLTLVKTLPEVFKPAEIQSSWFSLEAHVLPEYSSKSEDRLSEDLRTLLRVDVIFEYDHKPTIDARTPTHDTASSTVAKTILNTLQRPDASYLEMQVLGRSFLCTRCTSDPHYLTWKGIVSHFVYEHERWESASRWNKIYREEGGRNHSHVHA